MRLDRDDMLARSEHDATERGHSFLRYGLADHRIGLSTDLAIGRNVVGVAHIDVVDLIFWHELVDFDRMRAFDCNRFQRVLGNCDIPPLPTS